MKSLIVLSSKFGLSNDRLIDFIIIVQRIVANFDEGDSPPSVAIPEDLIDHAYQNSKIDFYFTEPNYLKQN